MSLFGLVFPDSGRPGRSEVLLAILGTVDPNTNPGRLRDAWVEKDEAGEPVIAIYTRNGGGNRDCYCDEDWNTGPFGSCTGCVGEAFGDRPDCIKSPDDDFDRTYRTYYFKVPADYRDKLLEIASDPVDTDQRWLDAINALKSQ